jgi:hypothetical protein
MSLAENAADGQPKKINTPATEDPARSTACMPMKGRLRLGQMRASRETFAPLTDPDLAQVLLQSDRPADTIIEADSDAEISIVDVDCHHWSTPPSHREMQAHLAAVAPMPDAAWISHGMGLKLVYVGPHHRDRALAAALSVPKSFTIELLQRTRHPGSPSSQHPGKRCGDIVFGGTDPAAPFEFRTVGPPTDDQRQQALQELGLEEGGTYDHDRCPIDPAAASDARGCVVVLNGGIFCHRCAGHGVQARPHLKPGFLSFAQVVGGAETHLDRLAESRVHWRHAQLELQHHHPHLGLKLLEEAYRRTLEVRWGAGDPRISKVFDPDLDFVWSDAGWLDSLMFQVTRVDTDAANGLPYVLHVKTAPDGTATGVPDSVRRSQVKHRTPVGYTPVRPVRGISFGSAGGAIPIQIPPLPRYPIDLLRDPIPEAEAFDLLQQPFPKLDQRYLMACLAAGICSEAGAGQPPMLICTGPSGSGKERHIHLVASFFGQNLQKLTLTDDEEKFNRSIGVSVTSGRRFLIYDEMGKARNLAAKLPAILQISSAIQWRPLHENRIVTTPLGAAFFFPCVRFPDFLRSSQEFARRTFRAHLHRKLPDWAQTCGGDAGTWRDRNGQNSRLANSLLTHAYRLCRECNFHFGSVAGVLELGAITDGESALDPELLRSIYRHARDDDGRRVLFQNDPTFIRGWINLSSPAAERLISAFVPLDDDDHKHAHRTAQNNLEAHPWNDVLGIDDPPITCRVKIHGTKWGLRFEAAEPAMKGMERINEELPPIPREEESRSADSSMDEIAAAGEHGIPAMAATATRVLAEAGWPQ